MTHRQQACGVFALLVSFAAGAEALALSPFFPPVIPANCPQFPTLNGPGVLCEDFDTNRNGVPGFQFTRLPIAVDPNDPLRGIGDPNDDVLGYTQSGDPSPFGTAARVCSDMRGVGRLGCNAPVAQQNDWHLHSPYEGPGAGYDTFHPPAIGAPDGGKAHSGVRSMHWGRHVDFSDPSTGSGTTNRFRQVAAYVLEPSINLGPASTLQFWHLIAVLNDLNAGLGFLPPGGTFGGGQVHISLLGVNGTFDKWRRLTPGFNGYDGSINETISICEFDPGDDARPPNDDTMCTKSRMWSALGDVTGTDATCTTDTDGGEPATKDCGRISSCTGGPGCTENGSLGTGVWARSRFDLSPFAGRQARLRWVGMMGGGWSFGVSRSLLEDVQPIYQYLDQDDGWWLDDIILTDLRQAPQPCGVDADGDGTLACANDCNDNDANVYPGAPELCDGYKNDCNDPDWPTWPTSEIVDDDGDGFTECQGDCNDLSPAARPGATEICDQIDNDCDGLFDEGFNQDGDDYSTCRGDCDDTRPTVYPGAPQICDGLNNDCLSSSWPALTGTNEVDADGDGFSVCQGDCNDGNAAAWGRPGEVPDLTLTGGAQTTVSWTPPLFTGGNDIYDVLRSPSRSNFMTGTTCAVYQTPFTQFNDSTFLSEHVVFYYLVRAMSPCPAGTNQGPLGFDSSGIEHNGRSCP